MKIELAQGQRLWFTSDTHYHHANICSATTTWSDPTHVREFKSLEHMDNAIVNNINESVYPDDILFHLGDWSFGGFERIKEFRDKIMCQNVHIVTGNHDHHIENNRGDVQSLFSSVHKYLELNVKRSLGHAGVRESSFILMHFPIASWNNMAKGAIHLHGHVHLDSRQRIGPGRMMDVGLEGNHLYPIDMVEVLTIMDGRPIKGMLEVDHHEIVENYK